MSNFESAAKIESSNRESILNQYETRDKNLSEMVDLTDKIDDLVLTMQKSDCYYQTGSCYGAYAWNANSDTLANYFSRMNSLHLSNSRPVNAVQDVSAPQNLWLLSLFGMNDTAKKTK